MKKRSSRYALKKSVSRTRTKFSKSWLDQVKLDDLSVLADSDSGCDGTPGGPYGDLIYLSPGGPTINGVPDPATCAYGWSLCCPCGTYLGQDSYFGLSACCDVDNWAVAGVNGQGYCATYHAQGWFLASGIFNPGYPPYGNYGIQCTPGHVSNYC